MQPPNHPPPRKPGCAWIALAILVPVPSLATAASMFWWPESAVGKLVFVAQKLWLPLLPVLWRRWVDREPWSLSPPRRGGFGVAVALGLSIAVAISLVALLGMAQGWIDPATVRARAARTGLDHRGLYLGGALYWITVNSLLEEYVWRWFVYRKFEVVLGSGPAVVGSALGFTLHHVIALAGQVGWVGTVLGSTGVFAGGLVWSLLYRRYQSVWPCYVSHAIVDIPIFVLGYWLIFGAR